MRKYYISKLLLTLIIILLFIVTIHSQNYLKMKNDSIFWDVYTAQKGYICTGYGGGGKRLYFGNDTLINGYIYTNINYYKMISDLNPNIDCPPFHVDTFSYNSYNLLREDTILKRIYIYNKYGQSEFLLFDYNLQKGDSILYDSYIYFKIDTIYKITTKDGIIRRKYEDKTHSLGTYFIEGLGGWAGPFEYPFKHFEGGPWLGCWGYFSNNLNNCYEFITNIRPNKIIKNNILIYPNPATDKITISKPDNSIVSYVLTIKNIEGQEMLRDIISFNNTYNINLNKLNNGIYFLLIQSSSGVYYNKLLINK